MITGAVGSEADIHEKKGRRKMKIQLLRHATMVIEYGGLRLLTDPMLSEPGTMATVANAANDRPNPTCSMPADTAVCLDADALLLTHSHRDHFDAAAQSLLPRTMPVFCQPPDTALLQGLGFTSIHPVDADAAWRDLKITRTGGQHGRGQLAIDLGPVSGYVLAHPGEPTLYITGDTVMCEEVTVALAHARPDVAVVFAGAAQFLTGGPITMDIPDILDVCLQSDAHVVVVHMEAFNHCLLSREDLAAAVQSTGLQDRVTILPDGEIFEWPAGVSKHP